jgi:hypothetical protein
MSQKTNAIANARRQKRVRLLCLNEQLTSNPPCCPKIYQSKDLSDHGQEHSVLDHLDIAPVLHCMARGRILGRHLDYPSGRLWSTEDHRASQFADALFVFLFLALLTARYSLQTVVGWRLCSRTTH